MSENKNKQITEQVQKLSELISGISDSIQDLRERLHMVLLEEDNEVAATKKVDIIPSVPLARDLQNVRYQVNNILDDIENIKRKLAL